MKYVTTKRRIREVHPCRDRWLVFLAAHRDYGDDDPIPFTSILASNGLEDTLWVLQTMEPIETRAQFLRLFACNVVERMLPHYEAQYPDDDRPRVAIATARRYAVGKATAAEMAQAAGAAWAAWAAAEGAWAAQAAAGAAWAAAGGAWAAGAAWGVAWGVAWEAVAWEADERAWQTALLQDALDNAAQEGGGGEP